MVSLEFCKSGPEKFWRGCPKKSGPPPTTHHPHPRSDPYIYQSIGFNLRIPDKIFLMGWTGVFQNCASCSLLLRSKIFGIMVRNGIFV